MAARGKGLGNVVNFGACPQGHGIPVPTVPGGTGSNTPYPQNPGKRKAVLKELSDALQAIPCYICNAPADGVLCNECRAACERSIPSRNGGPPGNGQRTTTSALKIKGMLLNLASLTSDEKISLIPLFEVMSAEMFDSLCDNLIDADSKNKNHRPAQYDGFTVPQMPTGSDDVKLLTAPHDHLELVNFTNKAVKRSMWTFRDDTAGKWTKEKAKYPRWKGGLQCEVIALLNGHCQVSYPTNVVEEQFQAYLCQSNRQWMLDKIRSHVLFLAGQEIGRGPVGPSTAASAPLQPATAATPSAPTTDLSSLANPDAPTNRMAVSEDDDTDDDDGAIVYVLVKKPSPQKSARSACTVDRAQLLSSSVDDFIESYSPIAQGSAVIALFDVERGPGLRAGPRIAGDYVEEQRRLGSTLTLSDTDKELVVEPFQGGGRVDARVLHTLGGDELCAPASPESDTTERSSDGSPMDEDGHDYSSLYSAELATLTADVHAIVKVVHAVGLAILYARPPSPTPREIEIYHVSEEMDNVHVNDGELLTADVKREFPAPPLDAQLMGSPVRRIQTQSAPTEVERLSRPPLAQKLDTVIDEVHSDMGARSEACAAVKPFSESVSAEASPEFVLTEAGLWTFARAQIITPAHISNMKEFLCLSEEAQETYIAAQTALNRPPTRSHPVNIIGAASARERRSRADLASSTPQILVPRARVGIVAGAKGAHVVPVPLDSTVSEGPTQPAVLQVELPSSCRATKKRKSVVHESQGDVDETENFEAFGDEDMSIGLELPTLELWADDRPPHEMVISAKNGKVWVDDGLLKPTELIHFFTILGLCRDWLIRLAIAAHVEQLDRDGFVAFAKEVLLFAGNRVSKMTLNKLKIKTRSDPAKPPVGLENKLRGRGQSSTFRELQPEGTFRSVTTSRPMYTTCVQLELQHFLREFTPGDSEDCVLLEPAFDRGLYVHLCERCNIPPPTGEMTMEIDIESLSLSSSEHVMSPIGRAGGFDDWRPSDSGDHVHNQLPATSDQSRQSIRMNAPRLSQDESAALDNSDQPDLNLQPVPLNVAGVGYEPCGCGQQQVDNPTAVLPAPSFNLGKSNGFRQIFSSLSQVAAAHGLAAPGLPTLKIEGDDESAGPADVFYRGHPIAHAPRPTIIVPDGVEAADAAALLVAIPNVQMVNEAMDVDVDWEEACGVDVDRLFA